MASEPNVYLNRGEKDGEFIASFPGCNHTVKVASKRKDDVYELNPIPGQCPQCSPVIATDFVIGFRESPRNRRPLGTSALSPEP